MTIDIDAGCGPDRPRTKIVATLGPASEAPETVAALIESGLSVARLNFSHGTHESHGRMIDVIRRESRRLGRPVAVLQDLAGPKVRVGRVREGGVELRRGGRFVLTTSDVTGDESRASIAAALLPERVSPGDTIYMADGMIELEVAAVAGPDIVCRVVAGGLLTSFKGVNFPDGALRASPFTDKDRADLCFGIERGVDLIGLSFVSSAADIAAVRSCLGERGAGLPVIAKIERREALENIDAIVAAADGIMVARGDLGVETPLERIPLVQKTLIRKARAAGKPVITATQMLRSMVEQIRPTRAEVTDVANAILDGTDAVMLSEETASGSHPVEAVRMMARIACAAEAEIPHGDLPTKAGGPARDGVPQAISRAAAALARDLDARAVVIPTESGSTARWVSGLRPRQPILAASRNPRTVQALRLSWGVRSFLVEEWKDTDSLFAALRRLPRELGLAVPGDRVVILAGMPLGVPGTTNLIKIEVVE